MTRLLCFLAAIAAFAQTNETVFFRGPLGDLRLSFLRTGSGRIHSASLTYRLTLTDPQPVRYTDLRLHQGPAEAQGPAVLDLELDPFLFAPLGSVARQRQVLAGDAEALRTLEALLADPGGFHLALYNEESLSPVVRAPLFRARRTVFAAPLANGGAAAAILVSTPASARLSLSLNLPPGGVQSLQLVPREGPPALDLLAKLGLPGLVADDGGYLAGTLSLDLDAAADAAAFELADRWSRDPAFAELELTPAGLRTPVRAAFRATERVEHELPYAGGAARITAFVTRAGDATLAAALLQSDINYRFPDPAELSGLRLDGPAPLQPGFAGAYSPSGQGNVFGFDALAAAGDPERSLAALEALLRDPDQYLLALAAPGVSAPLQQPGEPPELQSVAPAAPGALLILRGRNLAKTTAALDPWPWPIYPVNVHGVSVLLNGRPVPLSVVSGGELFAQVPFDLPAGDAELVVETTAGRSAPRLLPVTPRAPAILLSGETPLVQKQADGSWVGAGNPVRAGDTLVVWCTGLGQTTPPLATGRRTPLEGEFRAEPLSAELGGKAADFLSAVAAPDLLGLYQVVIRAPSVPAGPQALTLTAGGVASLRAVLPVE